MTAFNSDSPVPLSVIVPCFNEATMIADCLESVKFADEILVVDSFSTDQTLEIARRYTDRIVQHEFWSHGAQNNWAIPQAKHDWVLVVDADERVTPALAEEIQVLLRSPTCDGYWLRRRNLFLGREIRHGSWGRDRVLRLFRRDKGRYEEQHVHSHIELNGPAGHCRQALLHHSYRSLEDYARKVYRFSRGGAMDAHKRGRRSGAGSMVSHSLVGFFGSYVLKLGFLDGTEGLIIAVMEADTTFLKYARLWELNRAKCRSTATTPPPAAGPVK